MAKYSTSGDDAVGGCLTVYFLAVSDVTCVISWVVAFSAGCHSKLASPFTNDAGVILNNFIIIGDNYIRTYLTARKKFR